MKKSLLYIAALLLCSCTKQLPYVVEGSGEQLTGWVYLFDNDKLIDSAKVSSAGEFILKGSVERSPKRLILADSRSGQAEQFGVVFFAEPDTVTIVAKRLPYGFASRATGTPANDKVHCAWSTITALTKEYQDPATSEMRDREILRVLNDLPRQESATSDFDNAYGIVAASEPQQSVLSETNAKNTASHGGEESNEIEANTTKRGTSLVGNPYPNIIQMSPERQIVTLTSITEGKGVKCTLVVFWSSSSAASVKQWADLKNLYANFHSKGFQILGVSVDTDEQKWIGAIRANKIPGFQVSDLNGFDNLATRNYSVQSVPANFLIDSGGTIIAEDLTGNELAAKLETLLGK